MTRVAYPYLRPHPETVEPSPWTLVLGDETVALPDALDTWDYNLDLRLRRSIRVDVEAIRAQCRLPGDAVLDVCVVWRSSGSGLFGRAAAERLTAVGVAELDLDVLIPGASVGGVLDVDTVVLCTGQEPNRGLHAELERRGVAARLIGGAHVASELDAKRAIDEATRLAVTI